MENFLGFRELFSPAFALLNNKGSNSIRDANRHPPAAMMGGAVPVSGLFWFASQRWFGNLFRFACASITITISFLRTLK